ncbi:ribonuclease Y [Hyalella azteca]|uniref:Ribonuclease Y n=1 Tax=Hyalella azteca TaxID=294128 RepID=A0A8B7P3R3_HYAAZ|nr:ribonuclease Y [Hyalella azteca]
MSTRTRNQCKSCGVSRSPSSQENVVCSECREILEEAKKLAEADEEIASLRHAVASLRQKVEESNAEIASLREQLSALEEQLSAAVEQFKGEDAESLERYLAERRALREELRREQASRAQFERTMREALDKMKEAQDDEDSDE